MATRHQLESSRHQIASTKLTNISIASSLRSKGLLCILLLVSIIIGNHCASFGRVLRITPKQSNYQPKLSISKYARVADEYPIANRQSVDYFPSSPPNPHSSAVDHLLRQVLLSQMIAKNVAADQSKYDQPSEQQSSDYSALSNSDPLIDLDDYNVKLDELLKEGNNYKELLSNSDSIGYSASQMLDDDSKYNQPDSKSSYPIFFSSLDQPQESSESFKVKGLDESQRENGYKASSSDLYQLDEQPLVEQTDSKRTLDNKQVVDKEQARNLTTLIEDEDNSLDASATKSSNVDEIQSNLTNLVELSTTTASYGEINKSNLEQATDNKLGNESIFEQLYNKLVGYLPSISQLNIFSGYKRNNNSTFLVTLDDSTDNNSDKSDNNNNANTKQSVSEPIDSSKTTKASRAGFKGMMIDDNKTDKQTEDRKQQSETDDGSENKSSLKVGLSLTRSGSSDIDKAEKRDSSSELKPEVDSGVDVNEEEKNIGEGLNKVSLFRQSNLFLPLKATDELLLHTTSAATDDGPSTGSLLGKYIYAPEQHYYLNTVDSRKSKSLDLDEEPLYSQGTHQVYGRRVHPADNIYGSYNGLRPLYATRGHDDAIGIGPGKSNDFYFLVMVAAFCGMAMVVVLAAGLFAYRVQQSRNSNTETDYPTYGVVGPNSMNGKCGAASFVGGYFSSPGSVSMPNSKIGSAKHLPELGGSGSGDSGVVSTGTMAHKRVSSDQNNTCSSNNKPNFMANQNAARMYHYQHQKQQMIISDASSRRNTSASDLDSEDENDEGSYTVYECPGLASAHEMEIKNPLFNDDQTP